MVKPNGLEIKTNMMRPRIEEEKQNKRKKHELCVVYIHTEPISNELCIRKPCTNAQSHEHITTNGVCVLLCAELSSIIVDLFFFWRCADALKDGFADVWVLPWNSSVLEDRVDRTQDCDTFKHGVVPFVC